MTRRDYVAIAAAIRTERTRFAKTLDENFGARTVCNYIAHTIADHCAATNKAFDLERFLKACGVQS